MTFDLTEQEIESILKQYKDRKERDKLKYEQVKDDEEFKAKNREKAKNWYMKNKDKRKEQYQDNKDFLNARNHYYYYKKTNNLEKFKEKFPQKYDILNMYGYFNE